MYTELAVEAMEVHLRMLSANGRLKETNINRASIHHKHRSYPRPFNSKILRPSDAKRLKDCRAPAQTQATAT